VTSQITLRDVADEAGVHTSTASRALNEATRSRVNADTVARILRVAAELGYQRNELARGLKVNRTMSVGMLLPSLTNPLFPPIVRGIEDRLGEAGCTLLLGNTDNDPTKERRLLDTMARRRADGLILATARREYPVLAELSATAGPVVLVNRVADDLSLPSVASDDHIGIGLAVRYLVSLGHRRIAHLAGPRTISNGLVRSRSFLNAMEDSHVPADPELIADCDWFTQEAGAAAFASLLDRDVACTAVVAANDLIALGCYEVAADRGIRIPEDISVIGYNDMPFADRFDPPLTTIRVPHYQIGVKTADLMIEALRDPGMEPISVRLAPTLVTRASTAPPAHAA